MQLIGVALLEQYKKEVGMHEKDRQELANAEKLFDLPITMYPELVAVQKEMSGLDKVYEIYKQQKVSWGGLEAGDGQVVRWGRGEIVIILYDVFGQ